MKKYISLILTFGLFSTSAVAYEPLQDDEPQQKQPIFSKPLTTKGTYEKMDFPFSDKKHEYFDVIECEQEYTYSISNAYDPENDFVKTCLYKDEFLIEYDNSINAGIIRNNDKALFSSDLEISMCGPYMLFVFSSESLKNEFFYQYYDTHWGAGLRESGFSETRPFIGAVELKVSRLGCGLKGAPSITAP